MVSGEGYQNIDFDSIHRVDGNQWMASHEIVVMDFPSLT